MYQVTIKGRNLEELKKAVSDIHNELCSGTICNEMIKDMNNSVEIVDDIPITNGPSEEVYKIDPHTHDVAEHIIKPPVVLAMDNTIVPENVVYQNIGPTSGVELDGVGHPWDARIHTVRKTKTVKGVWKLMRGIDKDLVAKIQTEANSGVQAVPSTPVLTAPLSVPQVVEPAPVPLVINTPPLTPVTPPPTPLMNTNGGHTLETFTTNFAMIVGTLISEKKVTPEYVEQLNKYFNVTQIWEIDDNQKAEVFESFSNFGFITKVA